MLTELLMKLLLLEKGKEILLGGGKKPINLNIISIK